MGSRPIGAGQLNKVAGWTHSRQAGRHEGENTHACRHIYERAAWVWVWVCAVCTVHNIKDSPPGASSRARLAYLSVPPSIHPSVFINSALPPVQTAALVQVWQTPRYEVVSHAYTLATVWTDSRANNRQAPHPAAARIGERNHHGASADERDLAFTHSARVRVFGCSSHPCCAVLCAAGNGSLSDSVDQRCRQRVTPRRPNTGSGRPATETHVTGREEAA